MTTTSIYTLRDPRTDEIRYVGKTVQPLSRRLSHHRKESKRFPYTHRAKWLNQLYALGLEPVATVVEIVENAWAEAERKWIRELRAQGCRLVNATDGGDGTLGYSPTAEARIRLSAALTGRKFSPESRARMAAARLGKKRPPSVGAKVSEALRTRVIKETTRDKLRAAFYARGLPGRKGEQAGNAKLTNADVENILLQLSAGTPGSHLAKQYGVGKSTISRIKRRVAWTDIAAA